MKMKTGLLIIAFLVFYSLIHLGRYLPDLYNGHFSLVDERSYDVRLFELFTDILVSFLFTLSTYCALHFFYPAKKYFLLGTALLAAFVICFVINYMAAWLTAPEPLRLSRFFRGQVLYHAFYTIFAMVFYFLRYAQFKELQQRELSIQNRDSELSFLRSQINPHFLFNNLNNIYSLVYHKSEQSLAAISGLSELLRYMLYDTSETISLEKEIHYIEKYIALEQLRFETPGQLNFSYPEDTAQIQLPPLLLIPFIENAFKHGAVAFDHKWLDINISIGPDQQIILRCSNDVAPKHKDQTGGIGIGNVRKRLALLYPGGHHLHIDHQEHTFKVELRIESRK